MSLRSLLCFRPAGWLSGLTLLGCAAVASAGTPAAEAEYREAIEPLLQKYCAGCHTDGGEEAGVAFDKAPDYHGLVADRQMWWAALKNVRAGIMPPAGEPRPTPEEQQRLSDWIQREVFEIDAAHPDPGRVTLRRLNRTEYRNTVRDLLGVDYDTSVEFPPDDTGHGFDNIGDVLSISPLLLEKYLEAAENVVAKSVPTIRRILPVQRFHARDFRGEEGNAERLTFYEPASVAREFKIEHAQRYRIAADLVVAGEFEFDPGRCRLKLSLDGETLFEEEQSWGDQRKVNWRVERDLPPGEHRLTLELTPLEPKEKQVRQLNLWLAEVRVEGPLDESFWRKPDNYDRFFPRRDPPEGVAERREYAREILAPFVARAWRRPADAASLDRLIEVVELVDRQPGRLFEEGIAKAMTLVLASPRFLFRIEETLPLADGEPYPLLDEYSLASRLSYFLWSTMPDEELFRLAREGRLRAELPAQVDRMLKDPRSRAFVRNFVGQWLQARDVDSISIDPLAARGVREEYDALREQLFRRGFRRGREEQDDDPPEIKAARERFSELRELRDGVSEELKRDMRHETEKVFEYVVREDRSALELLDADYTFLNERLARHYGIEGVTGDELRRVDLPEGSVRGGVLTQGAFLLVTSNPTRTSPVKRGLFILENLLGTPTPPPPALVPELEEAQQAFAGGEKPPLRKLLEIHREQALCNSCHSRFDPLGLALENFNALGEWREQEAGQPIDPAGQLITGEMFAGVEELKQVLVSHRRRDFYRCLSERLLTYALGRGMEYYDENTLDRLVRRMEEQEGRFSTLLLGIVESAPFQRQRPPGDTTASVSRSSPAAVEDNP